MHTIDLWCYQTWVLLLPFCLLINLYLRYILSIIKSQPSCKNDLNRYKCNLHIEVTRTTTLGSRSERDQVCFFVVVIVRYFIWGRKYKWTCRLRRDWLSDSVGEVRLVFVSLNLYYITMSFGSILLSCEHCQLLWKLYRVGRCFCSAFWAGPFVTLFY